MLQQLQVSGAPVPATVAWGGSWLNLRGLARKARALTAHVLCGVSGHEVFVWRGEGRMALRCGVCGRESRGWHLNSPPPVLRFAGDPARHALAGHARVERPELTRTKVVRMREAS